MATLERTIDNLNALLDRAAVIDHGELEAQGYRIGARALFVEAAARGLRSRPRRDWDEDDVVAKARLFVTTMPGIYAGNDDHSHPLPNGDYLVQNRWTTGLSIGRKPHSWSSKVLRPSVHAEGAVTELTGEHDHTALRARAERLAVEATRAMRSVLGPLAVTRDVRVSRPHRHGYAFSIRLASGQPWTTHVDNARLLHDADAKILEPLIAFARGIVSGEAYLCSLPGRAKLQEAVDAYARSTGLPIALRLAPHPPGSYGGPSYAVLLDGYGESGEPETQVACTQHGAVSIEGLLLSLKNSEPVKAQSRLHAEFGPVPRERGDDMTIDAPTARRLATTGRGEAIARSILTGGPGDGGDADVALRVKGRMILGTFEIAPGVIWKGNRVDVQRTQVSDVVAAALPGRSLRDVVAHPVFGREDLVRKVQQRDSKTANTLVVHASTAMVALGGIDALAA